MRIPVHIAEKLVQLSRGESISSSLAKHPLIEELVEEGIIERKGRIQKKLLLIDSNAFRIYLQNKYSINDLKQYILISQKENALRSESVAVSSDSKHTKIRTFKGFLVNSYLPVQVSLNHELITLNPVNGIFQFIYDFEQFIPDKDITIVGIENAENFRHILQQKYLFPDIKPLFVCRYPQNQSKDLRKWLQIIPNNYVHFGDFDLAGIGIYLHEFKKYLKDKSTFFVPENIESLVMEYGSKKRYNTQKINFDPHSIQEEKLVNLISIIHKYKKGLDQEILIRQ